MRQEKATHDNARLSKKYTFIFIYYI